MTATKQPLVRPGGGRVATHGLTLKWEDLPDGNQAATASFSHLPRGSGLKSTQQLKVDWSNFQNHTFFQSAVVKTNVAFDSIINGCPFDGTRRQFEDYSDKLTGFEKWVYDRFPKSIGHVHFSGTAPGEKGGAHVSVVDSVGYLYPDLVSGAGRAVLDPGTDSFTLEFHHRPPATVSGVRVVWQKTGSGSWATAYVTASSPTTAYVKFEVGSGSLAVSASSRATPGEFSHHAFVYDSSTGRITSYTDGRPSGGSASSVTFGSLATGGAPVTIGSGSAVGSVTPTATLTGSLDEVRWYHAARTPKQIEHYRSRNVRPDVGTELKLCFRFNEPGDGLGGAGAVVLDTSGNALHSLIVSASYVTRVTGSRSEGAMPNEREFDNPILFAGNPRVSAWNSELVTSGSAYDSANPNLITNLVPAHYLDESQYESGEGDAGIHGSITTPYTGSAGPGTGRLGRVPELAGLLHAYAQFYDEIKLFVDAFAAARYVEYDRPDTAPDDFLDDIGRSYGFRAPALYGKATVGQLVFGEDIGDGGIDSESSLRVVENELYRRFLTLVPSIVRAKGTRQSVESVMRAYGLDPANTFKIRERGSSRATSLADARETRTDVLAMVRLAAAATSSIVSSPLSSSRRETGSPRPAGAMVNPTQYHVHGTSNSRSDGLWTSGSWTWEAFVKVPPGRVPGVVSVVRFYATGSDSAVPQLWGNLVASSGSSANLTWTVCPVSGGTATESTADVDVFDGSVWHVACGRRRADLTSSVGAVSASYFLWAARTAGGIVDAESYVESLASYPTGSDVQQTVAAAWNASGSVWATGAGFAPSGGVLLAASADPDHTVTQAGFKIGHVRFWSAEVPTDILRTHAADPACHGSTDPMVAGAGYTDASGSWERVRIETVVKQPDKVGTNGTYWFAVTVPAAGATVSGSGFDPGASPFSNEYHVRSHLSPCFDESPSDDKIRIRGYVDRRQFEGRPWETPAPATAIPARAESHDDPRVTIEMGLADGYNRDVLRLVGDPGWIEDAWAGSGTEFDDRYPTMEALGRAYRHRLSGSVDGRVYADFFRWVKTSLGDVVAQLIPRKSSFDGLRYVVEPAVHDRARVRYQPPSYLFVDDPRFRAQESLLLQQVAGDAKRWLCKPRTRFTTNSFERSRDPPGRSGSTHRRSTGTVPGSS